MVAGLGHLLGADYDIADLSSAGATLTPARLAFIERQWKAGTLPAAPIKETAHTGDGKIYFLDPDSESLTTDARESPPAHQARLSL
jgi:hypothetical protein